MNALSLPTRGALVGVSATILIALVRAPYLELPRWLFTMREPFEVRLIWSIVEAMPFSLGGGALVGAVLQPPPVDATGRLEGNIRMLLLFAIIAVLALVYACTTLSVDGVVIYVALIASLHLQALRVWRDA